MALELKTTFYIRKNTVKGVINQLLLEQCPINGITRCKLENLLENTALMGGDEYLNQYDYEIDEYSPNFEIVNNIFDTIYPQF